MATPDKIKAPAQMIIKPSGPFQPSFVSLEDVPGYKEAVAKERLNRLLSFFEVSQTICGFEVMPLTLRRYLLLELCASPFLSGRLPSPEQLAQFLWILSPEYEDRGQWAKRMFFRRCRKTFSPSGKPFWVSKNRWAKREAKKLLNAERMIIAIAKLIEQVMQDAPKGASNSGSKSYYHGAVSAVGIIASRYGWDEDKVLDKPMARLFQYARECRETESMSFAIQTGTKYRNTLSNPSDEITARFCYEEGLKSIRRN